MKQLFSKTILFAITGFAIVFLTQTGCKKDSPQTSNPTCDARGVYTGTSINGTGTIATMTYNLQDNNFAVGISATGTAISSGGYKNTCDSVFISVYYPANSSYYLLKGKLGNNALTISGSYTKLTAPTDFGTFSISK